MIGEGAFHPLKASGKGPESSKQAEMTLDWIVKILAICHPGRGAEFRDGNR
jgi:hypothetical protein